MNCIVLFPVFISTALVQQALAWSPGSSSLSRRDVLIGGGTVASTMGIDKLFNPDMAYSYVTTNEGEFANENVLASPIAVLGASGRTGALCVEACLKRGLPVRALTRTGTWNPPSVEGNNNDRDKLLSVMSCDVKDAQALYRGIQGCRAVIYAASASKKGGTPKDIDNDGVAAAAEACRKANVGRYVVLSSTAVTRPKSLGYIFTNLSVGGIMDEKRKGEMRVSSLYAPSSNDGSAATSADMNTNMNMNTPSYTIIRPGGLEEPKLNAVLGPSALEISQGDVLAGIISRADLAEVSVEMAISNAPNLHNTALELYYTDSTQPCEGRFKSLLSDNSSVIHRLHGDTYKDLFEGIVPEMDYYQT